jgi:hypothetical protein
MQRDFCKLMLITPVVLQGGFFPPHAKAALFVSLRGRQAD